MLDHIGFGVHDLARSRAFYEAALLPIGYSVQQAWPTAIGFGREGKPSFWIATTDAHAAAPSGPVHIAFKAVDHAAVDAFYAAAIAAGGRDNGGPGLRPQYHPNYYGAFVIDPDGHNVEAVCHGPG